MFTTYYDFYEKYDDGKFHGDPHQYKIETEDYPSPERFQELLFQAAEIDCLNGEVLCERRTELNGEYYDSDTFVLLFSIVTTDVPSEYFIWKNHKPHVFKVDRERSSISLVVD